MNNSINSVKAICFDLGNTLIEFGPKQIAYEYGALQDILREQFGDFDVEKLRSVRDRQIVAPFSNGFRENDMRTICEELITEIYDVQPEESQVQMLIQARFDAFVHVVEISNSTLSLLNNLRQHYSLGLLSNYPCSKAIRAGLRKIGLSEMFESVTISADVGFVKPHAKPFEVMTSQLNLSALECVYIGDNWLADVQGAKRIGMYSILTTQFAPYETFDPSKDDFSPDIRIDTIEELEKLFLN
ncbi:MAG: HAD family hydrolase [Proteobacteria bacterium]|nr:HAD family hydrolase [Pseudomonadota bacterium]